MFASMIQCMILQLQCNQQPDGRPPRMKAKDMAPNHQSEVCLRNTSIPRCRSECYDSSAEQPARPSTVTHVYTSRWLVYEPLVQRSLAHAAEWATSLKSFSLILAIHSSSTPLPVFLLSLMFCFSDFLGVRYTLYTYISSRHLDSLLFALCSTSHFPISASCSQPFLISSSFTSPSFV